MRAQDEHLQLDDDSPAQRMSGTGLCVPVGAAQATRLLRLAVVTPIPTPYRDAFWNVMARVPGIELVVYYCARGKSDRPWTNDWNREFAHEILPGANLLGWRGPDRSGYWNPSVRSRLAGGRFDAILIGGYNHATMWAAMRQAVRLNVPFWMMCESHLVFQRSIWREWVKRPLLHWIVRHAAGFLPTGHLAAEYLEHYGAAPAKMTRLPNVPDIDRLSIQAAELRRSARFPGPAKFAGCPAVLFVGRFIPKKRPDLVVRAFHQMQKAPDAVLLLVGDGPMRAEVERLVAQLGLQSRVHFAGFVQPAEILPWYARASVFVLPSSETWGVSALEAIAAGVPAIVSDEVGCGRDVITGNAVGQIVPARDQTALATAMQGFIASPVAPERVLQEWEPIRRKFVFSALAGDLEQAIRRST